MGPSKPQKSHSTHQPPSAVADFTVLPLSLPTLPGIPKEYNDAKHYVYIKPHVPSMPTPTADRSLFLANVPIDATERIIRTLFAEQLGGAMVESVEFDSQVPAAPVYKRWKGTGTKDAEMDAGDVAEKRGKKRKRDEAVVAEGVVEDEESALPKIWNGEVRRGGACAVVVFVDRRSARGAVKEVQKVVKMGRSVEWKGAEALGVERYKSHTLLTYPSPSHLQSTLNAYLTQFNTLETLRNKIRKVSRSVPDEDGFITVTRGGRTGPARIEEAEQKKEELEERKKKNGVKDDFYRFQNREKRKEEEIKLKKAFEKDRRRVLEMRERKGRVRPES